MEKRREISGPRTPNAPPREAVQRVLERIERLGIDWHEAVSRADLGRATGFRLLNGTASTASLRDLEEWVVKQEAKRKRPPVGTQDEQDARLAEWARLGEDLMRLDPTRFGNALEGLRGVVKAVELERDAYNMIFRPTPDAER